MMPQLANKSTCTGCKACMNVCSRKAIAFKTSDDGFMYPEINRNECVSCLKCEKVCPVNRMPSQNNYEKKGLAVKSKNQNIRMTSSSGGIFSILATNIIQHNGVVVGAAFTSDFHHVTHVIIDKEEDLFKLRGSKYLQSDIGDIYNEIKYILDYGRTVLFSGTGCQVAALKNFLGKEYDNLYLIDVVCHGVPSQTLWNSYLSILEKEYNRCAKSVNFRCKKIGWEEFGLKAVFGDNAYFKGLKDDPYLMLFQKNLTLRESCFHCQFKSINQISDLSIGDLWGADEIIPEFNDNRGISFLMVNSKKGAQLFDLVRDDCNYQEIEISKAINHNHNIETSARRPNEKDSFNKDYKAMDFNKFIKKYTKSSKREIMKSIFRRLGILEYILKIKNSLHGGAIVGNSIIDKNLEYGLLIVFSDKT